MSHVIQGELVKYSVSSEDGYTQLLQAQENMKHVANNINSVTRDHQIKSMEYGEVVVIRTKTLRERLINYTPDLSVLGHLVNFMPDFFLPDSNTTLRELFMFAKGIMECKPKPDQFLSMKNVFLYKDYEIDAIDAHTLCIVPRVFPDKPKNVAGLVPGGSFKITYNNSSVVAFVK